MQEIKFNTYLCKPIKNFFKNINLFNNERFTNRH